MNTRSQAQAVVWACCAAAACQDGSRGVSVDGCAQNATYIQARQTYRARSRWKIDYLFVVDNAADMCQAQATLVASFGRLAELLEDTDRHDYRIAVISADLEAESDRGRFLSGPVDGSSTPCPGVETDPSRVFDPADCDASLPTVLRGGRPDRNVHGRADLERLAGCLLTRGTQGDAIGKGLEAMRLALSCSGPNREHFAQCCQGDTYDPACVVDAGPGPSFLRPDAVLWVVFLSNKDDCSTPADNLAASAQAICRYGPADRDGDGVPDGYADPQLCSADPRACFEQACGGDDAETCYRSRCRLSRSSLDNCVWHRQALTPVEAYYEFLIGLKVRPDRQIIVSAITGPRLYTEAGHELHYTPGVPDPACDPPSPTLDRPLDECCPEGECTGSPPPSCESTRGAAWSGQRYLELADLFERAGLGCAPALSADDPWCYHICRDDYFPLLQMPFNHLDAIIYGYCLEERPVCGQPNGEGGFEPCDDPDDMSRVERYNVRVIIECDAVAQQIEGCVPGRRALSPEAWHLDLEASWCDSGASIALDDPSPPPDAQVHLEYWVAQQCELSP